MRRFPFGQILRHLNTTTSIGGAVKKKTKFWKIYTTSGRFSKITSKFAPKILGLATSGRHNSEMITNAENSPSKWSPYEMSGFYFYRYNQFKVFFPEMYAVYKKHFWPELARVYDTA